MTATSIPISQVVEINPEVIGTGGNPLALNALLLSQSAYASATQLDQYTAAQGAEAVGARYGTTSPEYEFAQSYFEAFSISQATPQVLFIGGYAESALPGYVRSASLAGMTLSQLQALGTGSLSVTIAGTAYNAAAINLAGVASFTAAAAAITTALTLGAAGACTWDPLTSTFLIESTATGATETISPVTGTLAAGLGFSGGTITQQGTAIDTPASGMNRLSGLSLNFATFALAWDNGATNIPEKTGFAAWSNSQNDDYLFVAWDTDPGYATPNNAAVFGSIVTAAQDNGTCVIGLGTIQQAGAIAGGIAGIDWSQLNGRTNIAFRTQAGLTPSVTDPGVAAAVLSNGAFYYGLYAARGQGNTYNVFYDGRMPGEWKWVDTYVCQLFMNSQFQLAIFTGLMAVRTAPYNDLGDAYIRAWMADPIQQAVDNGTIRAGVTLSASQIATIAGQAGLDISQELFNYGYYLQIGVATTQQRGARQSPPINFWYCDGGSIQQITVPSIAVL